MLYGNRTENDIAFRKELEALQQRNKNLKIVFILNEADSGWKGATGLITADMIKREMPDFEETMFYTCGPPKMVEIMEKIVAELGLPDSQLKREYFTGYT
jgi:ferredoxin-NADP reductase